MQQGGKGGILLPPNLVEGKKQERESTAKAGQFGGHSNLEKTDSDISRFTQDTAKRIGKSETFVKEH